jgi:hypothetical protein
MMPLLNSLARHLYRLGLRLYPLYLRRRYADQILLTLDDDWRDHRDARCRFWLRSFADLLQSSLRERLLMANDRVLARPIVTHALILGLVFSLLGVFATGVMQQLLRRGADQPQAQMASFYASEIASGVPPPEAIPRNYIDLERSLEPFVIVYDDQARPVVSTGYLNQVIPSPPSGVFRHVREHGSENVTWQPQANLRIASVIRRIPGSNPGSNPGFILTGRSLQLVEQQEAMLYSMAFGVWFVVVALVVSGALFLGRTQRRQPA